jgi:hypothetical protein
VPAIDPAVAEVLRVLLGSAVVAAIVSGLVAEWRAREADKRAVAREESAERRAEERDRQRARRDRWLQQIYDTQGDYVASMDWLMYRCLGSREEMNRTRQGPEYYPEAQWYLLGDEALLNQVFDLRNELTAREFASGFSDLDVARMGAQRGHVLARLENQRELVRDGNEPVWPSAAFVKHMLVRATEKFGVPPDYQPKIKDD